MQKAYLAIVSTILFFSAWLRFDGAFTKSFAFTYDVGRDMLALQSLSHGHISLIGFTTGLPGVFYGPWWYWMLLPAYLIGQGNPQYVAGFMALCGSLTVLLLFLLGRKIGGAFLSLVVLVLSGVSGQLISLSSQIWNPNVAPLWLSLMIMALYYVSFDGEQRLLSRRDMFLWFLLGILIGLLFEAEIVFGTLFVCGFVLFIVLYVRRFIRVTSLISAFIGFCMILSPRILFELRHHFLMTRTILTTFGQSSSHSFTVATMADRTQFLLGEWSNTVGGNNRFIGIIVFFITLGILLGTWKQLDKKLQFFVSLGSICTSVSWILLICFQHDVWSHYVVAFPVLWILLVSLALFAVWRYWNKCLAISIFLLLALINLQPQKLYTRLTQPLFTGDISVYRNQLAIIDEVYKESSGRPFKYIVYTAPIVDYPYQYLFTWYGKKQYGYVPSGPDAKTMFVIIEPDTQHPTLRANWIRTHTNDGMIVSEKQFVTGVILQKRIIQ